MIPGCRAAMALLLLPGGWGVLSGAAGTLPPVPTVFQVAPGGDDRAAGTAEAPLATLSAALARTRRRGVQAGGTIIRLAGGTYRLGATIELEAADSGLPEAPLVLEGPSDGTARLTGAQVVTGLTRLTAAAYPDRVPTAARGHLWAARLDPGAWPDLPGLVATGFGRSLVPHGVECLFRGKVLPLAAWPNQGYATVARTVPGGAGPAFAVAEGARVSAWGREPDLWAHGYWNQDWRDSYEQVVSIKAREATLQLGPPGPIGGVTAGQRFRVLNALSELDQPGEWYLDRATRILYLWPPADPKEGDVELTVLPVILRMRDTRFAVVRNLTFDGARTTGVSLQGVQSVQVVRCRMVNMGGAGLDLLGRDSRVEACDIRGTGEGGIYLTGGDRQSLEPGGLVARGNRITDFNRWGRCYRPAIQLNGVGNAAESNDIREGSHAGILFYGNDHRVSCNTLSRLCLETGDAGAIYGGQDWTAQGCLIEGNCIADVWSTRAKPVVGIYLDDQLSGTTVRGNLLQRVQVGILVGGGRDTQLQGNWFEGCGTAISFDGRGLTWQKDWISNPSSPIRKNLAAVPYRGSAYRKYPGAASVLTDRPGAPIGTRAVGNRSVGAFVLELRPEAQPWITLKDNRDGGRVPAGFPGDCSSKAAQGGE